MCHHSCVLRPHTSHHHQTNLGRSQRIVFDTRACILTPFESHTCFAILTVATQQCSMWFHHVEQLAIYTKGSTTTNSHQQSKFTFCDYLLPNLFVSVTRSSHRSWEMHCELVNWVLSIVAVEIPIFWWVVIVWELQRHIIVQVKKRKLKSGSCWIARSSIWICKWCITLD